MISVRNWPRFRRTEDGATVHVATVRGLGFEEELGDDGQPLPPNPLTTPPKPYLLVEEGFKASEEQAEVTRIIPIPVPMIARMSAAVGSVVTVEIAADGDVASFAMMTPAKFAAGHTPEVEP